MSKFVKNPAGRVDSVDDSFVLPNDQWSEVSEADASDSLLGRSFEDIQHDIPVGTPLAETVPFAEPVELAPTEPPAPEPTIEPAPVEPTPEEPIV